MSGERKGLENDAFRRKPIASGMLWEALKATLDILGPSMKDATISELQKSGVDPEGIEREYTLEEIGAKLSTIFGKDGTEVILVQLTKRLRALEK